MTAQGSCINLVSPSFFARPKEAGCAVRVPAFAVGKCYNMVSRKAACSKSAYGFTTDVELRIRHGFKLLLGFIGSVYRGN